MEYRVTVSADSPLQASGWSKTPTLVCLYENQEIVTDAEKVRTALLQAGCPEELASAAAMAPDSSEPGAWRIPLPTEWATELFLTRDLEKEISGLWVSWHLDWEFSSNEITEPNQVSSREWHPWKFGFSIEEDLPTSEIRSLLLRAGCPEGYLNRYLGILDREEGAVYCEGPLPKHWIEKVQGDDDEEFEFSLFGVSVFC